MTAALLGFLASTSFAAVEVSPSYDVVCADTPAADAHRCTLTLKAVGASFKFEPGTGWRFWDYGSGWSVNPDDNATCSSGLSRSAGQSCTFIIRYRSETHTPSSIPVTFRFTNHPDVIVVVNAFTAPTYTYSWETSLGTCAGGTGSWTLGGWMSESGCGLTSQSRTVGCGVDEGSGTQAVTVVCRRSDGTIEADESKCTDPRPAETQSCTPTASPLE